MSKAVLKSLPELEGANIITPEVSANIKGYYAERQKQSQNRLIIAFSMLGAILVGLGIVLILGHNWDELSKSIKTFIAFVPLVVGQILGIWVILKKKESMAFREAAGSFLFFGVGICLSLISQIYHTQGNIEDLILIWIILCAPLIYLLRSSAVSLLYLIGVTTFYVCKGIGWRHQPVEWYYLGLWVVAIPHYVLLLRNNMKSNFTTFHHWFWGLSLVVSLMFFCAEQWELIMASYAGLFAIFLLVGNMKWAENLSLRNNAFRTMGILGLIAMYLNASFNYYWKGIYRNTTNSVTVAEYPEFWLLLIFAGLFIGFVLYRSYKSNSLIFSLLELSFLAFVALVFVGFANEIVPKIGMSIVILAIGINEIRNGAKEGKLGQVNFGLIILTFLIALRFTDSKVPFVLRGIMFVAVGLGFFATNIFMIRKRRKQEELLEKENTQA